MVHEIRELRPATRALFMSGHIERTRGLADELGEEALVLKPIAPSDLIRRARAMLDRPPGESPSATQ